MLAIESQDVIGLRLKKIAYGEVSVYNEVFLMVSEKIDAAVEAGTTLMAGGSAAAVVARYREHVASNAGRLSANGHPDLGRSAVSS
jgi:hypothetical protein